MSHGSQQLRRFRIAVRDGVDIETAAEQNGMAMSEARSWVADDLKNPPPPEAFVLLGHNSGDTTMSNVIAADALRLHIEALERLDSERQGIAEDTKERYALAKSEGFDPKTMRKIIARRKLDAQIQAEADMLLATYATALGMQMSFDL